MTLALRDYQRAALDAITAAEARGRRRIIVSKPTGAGKTVTFAHLIHERGGRAIALAHRDELVRQAAEKIRMVTGRAPGIVKAEEDEYLAPVVVASVQTLVRPARMERLMGGATNLSLFGETPAANRFRTVIVDEAHHASADTYVQVLRGLGCFDEGGPLTVGFTATPERTDDKSLGSVFEEIVYSLSILDGIRGGWLCDIRGKQVKLRADFNALHVRAGEFRDEETAEMLMEAKAPQHAAEAYREHASDRQGVIFTPTILVAHAMAKAFRDVGFNAEAVDGEMPLDQRRAILQRVDRGTTQVVANAAVLTEGWDCPRVSCAVMARPTRSRGFAIQCIGRVLRPYPGKQDALVIDLVGSALRHDLVTVATLFDVSPGAAEVGVAAAVGAKECAIAAGEQIELAEAPAGRLVSVNVDLFKGRDFSWIQGDGGGFVLRLGEKGDLRLEQTGQDEFNVVRAWRERIPGRKWPIKRTQMLAEKLSLSYAQGFGEDFIRKAGAAGLNSKDAGWRSTAASEKQVAILKKRGRWRDGMDRGAASDAITAMYGR